MDLNPLIVLRVRDIILFTSVILNMEFNLGPEEVEELDILFKLVSDFKSSVIKNQFELCSNWVLFFIITIFFFFETT